MECNKTADNCVYDLAIPPIVSDKMMFYFRFINWTVLVGIINTFGVISNGLNMAVIYRMGFTEKQDINLSLFALAISDFGSCLTSLWLSVGLNPWFKTLNLPFESEEIAYILGAWPHVAFTKITTLITAFITFERCLCVWFPIKIKSIITRTRILCYLIFCYVLNIALMIPIFYSNRIGRKFYIELNRTILGLVFTDERAQIESVVYLFLNVLLSMAAFVVIIILTVLLVVKLREKSKWRQMATGGSRDRDANENGKITKDDKNKKDNEKNVSSKDQKVSKMVVMISTLFIVCFIPTVAMQSTMWLERKVSFQGAYANLNEVMASFTFLLESVNTSVNILIYYRNSSNYKSVFDRMFRSKKQ